MDKSPGPYLLNSTRLKNIEDKVNRILICVEGDNDHTGLKMEVDRLSITCRTMQKFFWALVVGMLGVVLERLI